MLGKKGKPAVRELAASNTTKQVMGDRLGKISVPSDNFRRIAKVKLKERKNSNCRTNSS